MLDGPANEPRTKPRRAGVPRRLNNPRSGATATNWPDPMTIIARTAVETSARIEEPHPLERVMGQPMD